MANWQFHGIISRVF